MDVDSEKQISQTAKTYLLVCKHDDVIKWKHFPRYWPFVRGIHRWPLNSPHKGQWHGALTFSLICDWINGWVNNGEAGDLRRHRAHYDVTVMKVCLFPHYKVESTVRPLGRQRDDPPLLDVQNSASYHLHHRAHCCLGHSSGCTEELWKRCRVDLWVWIDSPKMHTVVSSESILSKQWKEYIVISKIFSSLTETEVIITITKINRMWQKKIRLYFVSY